MNMMYRKLITYILVASVIIVLLPLTVLANHFTLPVDNSPTNAWFDHDTTSSQMTKYDGSVYSGVEADLSTCGSYNNGAGCYDDHNGTDFDGDYGENILAPADGEVKDVYWNNEGGWTMHIWHATSSLSTLYAHIATTTIATTSDLVTRGEHIAEVDSTGSGSTGAHLHFGVVDSESLSGHRIDPFGWQGSGSDPWTYDKGYLWTTDPPSFNLASTVPSSITASTTWRGNYYINGEAFIDSDSLLTLEQGTVLKFELGASRLVVRDGSSLYADGSDEHPVYFTSIRDDSVAGDTNEDGSATSPVAGNWDMIKVNAGASTTLNNTVISYGGYSGCCYGSVSNLYNDGGILKVFNSEIATTTNNGIYQTSGTTTVSNTDIHDQNYYGILVGGGDLDVSSSTIRNSGRYGVAGSGTTVDVSLQNNEFSDNDWAVANINNIKSFSHSGNSSSGTGLRGYYMEGNMDVSQTWTGLSDLPYIVGYFTIPSGKTLTIDPGAVIKFDSGALFNQQNSIVVNGTLDAEGDSGNKIYFTSIKDDSVGGDTNGDGGSTSPAAGNWGEININTSTASSTISNSVITYGGYANCCFGSGSSVYNHGGVLNLFGSEIATSSGYGLYSTSGTTTAVSANIHNQSFGIVLSGGLFSIASSSIQDNSSYGFYNNTASVSTAENNYWGDSSGPYHSTNPSGTGNAVSDYVDFDPWLTSAP